ncbi:MAG TPA: ATP-binding protein [Candidatus Onthousia faecipullorum]|uniref:ATP-binding protein n=1 Tax=Candidatus Onthousia faecipullorum TaxID=2840887 RepID=A0A9D1GB43_9FIRM|nr:ATP-binding protein [Candidatus Onthousia faecipullorum]
MKYLPRIVDKEIDELMEIMGAILIEGCKWCGKSTTGLYHAKSVIEFQNPDRKQEYDNIRNTKPSLFLNGEKPRMFDEWQMYPVVWDSVRTDVDHTGLKGQYILTGSAKPSEGETMHTGTGRISRVLMRPMSLFESSESTGEVSFSDILAGKDISGVSKLSLEDIASIIVRGGWPASISIKSDAKYRIAKEYVKSLIHEEVRSVDGVERNTEKMQNVLRSLARNISTQVSNSTIEADIRNSFDDDISRPTLTDYLNTLEKLFVIEDVKATNLNLRSRYALRTKPKKFFVDPSIATAILDLKPMDLINDLNTFGFMFESLCIRDLKIYTESLGGDVTFYRDERGFEVDAILRMPSGKWGAIEIKLGAGYIDEAANNLLKFKEHVDIKKCGEPSFLLVLTGTNYSYKRDDGVYVVSIGTLKN